MKHSIISTIIFFLKPYSSSTSKTNIYIILTVLLLSVSCTKKEDDKTIQFNRFPQTENLKGKIPNMESHPLRLYDIEIKDSLIIVFDYYHKDKRLYILNSNNFSLLASSGKTGKGPEELTIPYTIDLDKENNIIWVGDRGKQKIFGFPLDSILMVNKELPEHELQLDKNTASEFQRIRKYSDSTFAIAIGEPELFQLFNFSKNTITKLGQLPEKRKDREPEFGFEWLWQRNIRILENKDVLISFTNFDKIIRTDSLGNTKFLITGPDEIEQKREYVDTHWKHVMNNKRGYGPCYQYNDKIYCLYSGEAFAIIDENHNTRQQYYKKICVFSSEGEPLKQYNLDHEIRDFAIDTINNRVIGLSVEEKEPFIIYSIFES